MRNKILRQTTIIPSELYVPREADRQLRNVLNDMGRPGYVLVARQMGKTNLLLHAKQEMQDANNVFVYIDLTNRLPTLRECFRNIIDVALETHDDLANVARHEILTRRASADLPAHKEHEMELRSLLKIVPGKLVIILDEIDALTSQDYSDQLFAQIRSTFFSSRVNFAEFHRLTYVLSGVAEPTEIIKNPKISPFNIGHKIYLGDFTYEEYQMFLGKAGLELSLPIIEQIFEWVNGNPRMTWDICSAIEDRLLSDEEITTETVDNIAQKLYLENFDLPPIDHIRTLVENDRTIRNAVMEIRYGKGNEVSDAVKTRLYLAGITKATDTEGLRIKNKIIDMSLSEQWITDIDKKKLGTHRLAVDKLKARQYEDAIPLFEEHLRNNATSDTDRLVTANSIAHCYLNLSRHNEALDYFQRTYGADEESMPELWAAQKHGIAWCHFHLSAHDEARVELWHALKLSKAALSASITSLWMLSQIATQQDKALLNIEELESICKRIIDRLRRDSDLIENERVVRFKARVFLSMAMLCSKLDRADRADEYLRRAIEECGQIEKPAIRYYIYKLERDTLKKDTMIIECANEVINQDSASKKLQPDELPILTKEDNFTLLLKLYEKRQTNLFDQVIKQLTSDFNLTRAQVLYELAALSIRNHGSSFSTESAKLMLEIIDEVMRMIQAKSEDIRLDNKKMRDIYKFFLLANMQETTQGKHFQEYIELLLAATPDEIKTLDSLEVVVLTRRLFELAKGPTSAEAIRWLESINTIRERTSMANPSLIREFSVIDYGAMSIMKRIGNKQASAAYAKSAFTSLSEDKSNVVIKYFLPDKKDIDGMFAHVKREIGMPNYVTPSPPSLYGRNEKIKVRDQYGNILEMKYKKIEDAIRKGIYTIVKD